MEIYNVVSPFFILALLLLVAAQAEDEQVIINMKVKRVIDMTGITAVTRTTVTMKNTGSDSVSQFVLVIPPSESESTNDIWVTQQTKSSTPQPLLVQPNVSSSSVYIVQLSSAIFPSSTVTVDIRQDVYKAAKPVPSTISRFDSQYLKYTGLAHYYSIYKTKSEQTSILLPTSTILSQKNVPHPNTITNKRMELGPFKNIKPLTIKEISLRYKNDNGFLVAKKYVKQVSHGHWGKINVIEEYDIYNAAANFQGEWSRIDYMSGFGTVNNYKTAIGDIWANLPSDANDIFYQDLIGNITTSKLRKATKSKRAIQLKFRFPLMGGWKNFFWYKYDLVDVKNYLSKKNQYYYLKIPVSPTVNSDLLCENFQLKIILPEWAEDIQIINHPSISFKTTNQLQRLSLTLFGRNVITLNANMLRSKSKHDGSITIRYKYNDIFKWLTPTLTITGVFIVIVVSLLMVLSGIDVGSEVVDDKKEKAA